MDDIEEKRINIAKENKLITMREYRKNNLDKLKEKIYCELCDTYYQKYNKDHHQKTNKHQTALKIKAYDARIKELEIKATKIKKIIND